MEPIELSGTSEDDFSVGEKQKPTRGAVKKCNIREHNDEVEGVDDVPL